MMKKLMFREPTNAQEQNRIRWTAIIILIAATGSILVLDAYFAFGQIISKDDIVDLPIGGNATMGEIDLSIDFADGILPPNGTAMVSTEGITDIDIQSLPPAGISIILDNGTATVTNHPVIIASENDVQAVESNDDDNGDE